MHIIFWERVQLGPNSLARNFPLFPSTVLSTWSVFLRCLYPALHSNNVSLWKWVCIFYSWKTLGKVCLVSVLSGWEVSPGDPSVHTFLRRQLWLQEYLRRCAMLQPLTFSFCSGFVFSDFSSWNLCISSESPNVSYLSKFHRPNNCKSL